MELKIWTSKQLDTAEQLQEDGILPMNVFERIKNALTILDNTYGIERDRFGKNSNGEGGYILITTLHTGTTLKSILQKVRVDTDEFEYEEEITINTTQKWKERLYLIDNDYGIIFFYPMEAVQK